MYTCSFCEFSSENLDDFEEDFKNHKGFWCPYCDGFTFFGQEERSYILYLEDKDAAEKYEKMPFLIHCSPLRYPGGKSKFVGRVLEKSRPGQMEKFVEPFAGGASVGLSLLLSGNIKELYLNDADYGIYALFQVIKGDPEVLKERIIKFSPTKEEYYASREIVLGGYQGCSMIEAAWHLLVVNRLTFSGIAFANCMSNPAARWNAKTLCRRIDRIHAFADKIHVYNQDALEFIEEMYWMNATIFIDPPYYAKGEILYPCSYGKEDHFNLALWLDELHKGIPGADIIVTYDLQKEIKEIYHFPKQIIIGRNYSIAN